MSRILLTYVVPIVLPTALYFLWLNLLRRSGKATAAVQVPWVMLLGAGVLLAAVITAGTSMIWEDDNRGEYERPPFSFEAPPEPGQGR